ncbi:indolepyruvate ferredoxin oxidoreductase, alpha subunit [Caldicellulosiruptor owensensis OL]|uniref:Indolepyruvate oxidoreductase subunit IorA n=1 Tax=Caldicellulosiruptor owensensis (strain ATCC 700167 / DSM 13100 / OL) TaxID=632518 RepID=E4Q225_CALOW|nr:indolepyruvate ferredoxin oxidoreductase subunit alpha [Caldicellulosiruptor owensensis]ADQ04843.1 indolepyruvate ferredoxin oxidoreductase, alpha subunit [Caldicellulosiruptor owensensis OL]
MKKLLLGNHAVARGCYEAGVKVATAYPGTPSTEITEAIAKYDEIYCEWAPNEKVALEVAIGASIYGRRAICSMKHVGLNVAADPLFTVSYTGVNAGLLIAVADDPGMHSSQNEQDTRNIAKAAKVPVLEPADSQECIDFVKIGFEISEKFDTPVILRLTTRVAHSQSVVEEGNREEIVFEYKKDIQKYVMMPAMARVRHEFVEKRLRDLKEFAETLKINKIDTGTKEIAFIASGIAYQYIKEAYPDAWVLKLGMVWPLPEKMIKDFCSKFDKVYIVEELDPFLEENIKALGINNIVGKEIFKLTGEYSPSFIKKSIENREIDIPYKVNQALAPRFPVLCPGCPHRGIFYVLGKLKDIIITGDIGCYTLGALSPFNAMDTCVCMGASVGMAHGISNASDKKQKVVAVIGDSTFIHSGITGVIDAVYNGSDILVLILDNSTTGMTGHQDHPSTGYTIKGEQAYKLDLATLCKILGCSVVEEINPYNINENLEKIKKLIDVPGVKVAIARAPCRLHRRYKFAVSKRYIDSQKCKNCKMCLNLGCPAISIKERVFINENLCLGCGMCETICKFGAILTQKG